MTLRLPRALAAILPGTGLALAGALLFATPAHATDPRAEGAARVIEARAFGPSFPEMSGPARTPDGRMSTETRQSVGCLLLGTGMTTAAALAGAENLIHIIGGGVVPARNQAVLYLGTLGVTFGTFCAVGAALTPLWDEWRDGARPAATPPSEAPAPSASPGGARVVPARANGVLADRLLGPPPTR